MTCGPPSEHSPIWGDSHWSTAKPFFARGLGLAATMLERSALYSSRCEPNRIGSTELSWFVHAKGLPSRQASQRHKSKTDVLTRASPINAGVGGEVRLDPVGQTDKCMSRRAVGRESPAHHSYRPGLLRSCIQKRQNQKNRYMQRFRKTRSLLPVLPGLRVL